MAPAAARNDRGYREGARVTDLRDIESTVEHRPWPMPRGPWVLFQSWQDLLFAHWPLAPELLRPLVPPELELDLHDGSAWLGITPFRIEDFRPRGLPALPAISSFPELNLRTYVRAKGKPGIHFFSLDAGSRLAVAGAKSVFRLPYRYAEMGIEEAEGKVGFRSQRPDGAARFRATYEPVDHAFEAPPGTLEHFLTERYALFVVLRSREVLETEIHHRPWPLQPAEGVIHENALPPAESVPVPEGEPLLHFSRRQDTLIWPPRIFE